MSKKGESRGMLGTLIYLAFGLLVYLVLFEPESGFSWADPWVYIVAVFWPFALIYKLTVAIVLLIVIAAAIAFAYGRLDKWRRRRSGRHPPGFD